MAYTYWDYDLTGAKVIRRTRGLFAGWTEESGVFGFRYARFECVRQTVYVPEHRLTRETLEKLRGEVLSG